MAVAGLNQNFYIKNVVVPFEEDQTHEFKGHRCLSVDELPGFAFLKDEHGQMSRKPVSRYLNAFLNTGIGGVVYLGIIDDGVVKGIRLTEYQKDHVRASVDDLLVSRYIPAVPKHRYCVRFVPVIEDESDFPTFLHYVRNHVIDEEIQARPHLLRTSKYCWCDKDAVAQFNSGLIHAEYVIEILIKKWDPGDPRNANAVPTEYKIHPIHLDEERNCYFRHQASIKKVVKL